MTAPILGLYIGTESVDCVQIGGTPQRPRVLNSQHVSLPKGGWKSQVLGEEPSPSPLKSKSTLPGEDDLGLIIQSLVRKITSVTLPKVYISIASEAVVSRYFQMPVLPPHERQAAISFEAKKYIPFKLEELFIDYQEVIRKTDSSVMRVMFMGIKKTVVERIMMILRSASVIPLCLEPSPVSFMRLARMTNQFPQEKVIALLWVEHDSASINIAKNDLLYLSRNVNVANPEEAEDATQQQLFESLTQETRVSLDYYRRRFLAEPEPVKVIIYSTQPMDSKKVNELKTALDLPIEVLDPVTGMAGTGAKQAVPGIVVAVGCALRGLEKTRVQPINLLPSAMRRESMGLLKPVLIECIIVFILLMGCAIPAALNIQDWEQKVQSARQKQMYPSGLRPQKTLVELQSYKDNQQKEIRFFHDMTERRGQDALLLAELAKLLPSEAWFRTLTLEDSISTAKEGPFGSLKQDRSLQVSGGSYAADRSKELERVNGYLEALRSSKLINTLLPDCHLEGVQRGRFKEEEATEFKLSGGTKKVS